jgi:hypothetical protein
MGEVLMATPAISDGIIFVRGLKHLLPLQSLPPEAKAVKGLLVPVRSPPAVGTRFGRLPSPDGPIEEPIVF